MNSTLLRCLCLLALGVSRPPSPASAAGTSFVDVAQAAGVSHLQHSANEPPECLLANGEFCEAERMTGGAAVADVDRDGDLDLFVTRVDTSDILYVNRGDGTFEDGTLAAGLAGYVLQSNGALFADIENDGDPDLIVTVIGDHDPVNNRNYLFVNDGSGVFTEEAVSRGVDLASTWPWMSWGVSAGDYDRDGYLDIHLTDWFNGGVHSRLLHNLGAAAPGYFEDVTAAAGLQFGSVRGFASTFVDLDGDGWQDLAVAGDFGTSRLFWNDGDGTFTDGTGASGVGTDENGMGSTFGDVDADGDLDWFVTSIYDPDETCESADCNWGYTGNRLYRNEGGRLFSDATDAAGVREGFWGWGAVFFDYDNDGDLDLAMTNGVDFPGAAIEAPFNADPMRVWENDGTGQMAEVSAEVGVTDTGSGKGLLVFDYDSDGDLDLFVANNAGPARLYRNELNSNHHWIRVKVRGRISNRDANGARVAVWAQAQGPPQVREVGVASHFVGQSERVLHFGLGPGVSVVPRIEVTFPASGRTIVRRNVTADATIVITEGQRACGLLGIEGVLAVGLAGRALRRRSGGAAQGAPVRRPPP